MNSETNDDELKHIDKNKEIAEQFDYSTSQVNELDGAKPASDSNKKEESTLTENPEPVVTPSETVTVSSGNVPSMTIFRVRYMAIIVAMLGVNYALSNVLPYMAAPFSLLILYVALTGTHTAALKNTGRDELLENDRMKMIALLAGNPIISHILYYFQLRKQMPHAATFALKTGFKVLGIILLCVAVMTVVIVSQSWEVQHGQQMKNAVESVRQDALRAEAAAKDQDVDGLRKSCQDIVSHVGDMRKVQEHPDKKIREKITQVEDDLAGGAESCMAYVDTGDERYSQQSVNKLNEATSGLAEVNKLLQESN